MRRSDEALQELQAWDVDPENFSYVEVRTKLPSNSDAIYVNRCNVRDGVLIHVSIPKEKDKNPEAWRLNPSEIAWRSSISSAEKEKENGPIKPSAGG